MKNSAVSQLITVTGPKSEVAILFGFPLIKNETDTFGNPQSRPTSFDLELIRPEYTRPSGACIQ